MIYVRKLSTASTPRRTNTVLNSFFDAHSIDKTYPPSKPPIGGNNHKAESETCHPDRARRTRCPARPPTLPARRVERLRQRRLHLLPRRHIPRIRRRLGRTIQRPRSTRTTPPESHHFLCLPPIENQSITRCPSQGPGRSGSGSGAEVERRFGVRWEWEGWGDAGDTDVVVFYAVEQCRFFLGGGRGESEERNVCRGCAGRWPHHGIGSGNGNGCGSGCDNCGSGCGYDAYNGSGSRAVQP